MARPDSIRVISENEALDDAVMLEGGGAAA
jgi:hypothetical protein